MRKIFSEIISAVSKLVPENDGVGQLGGNGLALERHEIKVDLSKHANGKQVVEHHHEHEEEVDDKEEVEIDEEEEVEIDLADGLSIFAGWPNICKLLW